ncbi:MAG: metal-dependent transcriptional regulator [Cyanobacteria bacterium SIG29]|nr:metal-dependent transcriptional regulator [Cyanobacteria bacterium SIG29]
MSNLTASLEDYLEIICNLSESSQSVKAVEIAKKLNISRASVSEALSKLADKELILYESYKGITITEKGLKTAKEVIAKHNILSAFFNKTLGLSVEEASNNACKIEHVITDELFSKIRDFQKYCDENKEIVEGFRKQLNA